MLNLHSLNEVQFQNLLNAITQSGGGGGGSSDAKDITFDNTNTGMTATNVQDAIDEVFRYVSNGKQLIADAITDKGILTSATDTFSKMAENIRNISGSTSELIYTLTEGGVWKDIDYIFNNTDFGTIKAYSIGSDVPLVYNFVVGNIAIFGNYSTIGQSSENLNINLSRVVYNETQSKLKISLSNFFSSTERIELYKIIISK